MKWILPEADAVLHAPGLQCIGATGGNGRATQPAIAMFLDMKAWNGGKCDRSAKVEEERRGVNQFHTQGVSVQRPQSKLRGVFEFSDTERLRAANEIKLPRVVGTQLGFQDAQPRIDNIFGCDRLAGRPDRVGP